MFVSLRCVWVVFLLLRSILVFKTRWTRPISHLVDIENLHDISNIRNKHSILYRCYFDRQMKILCACALAYIYASEISLALCVSFAISVHVKWACTTRINAREIINGASSWFFHRTESNSFGRCFCYGLCVVVTYSKLVIQYENVLVNYIRLDAVSSGTQQTKIFVRLARDWASEWMSGRERRRQRKIRRFCTLHTSHLIENSANQLSHTTTALFSNKISRCTHTSRCRR